MSGWVDEWVDRWTDQVDGWIGGWVGEYVDGWTDEQMINEVEKWKRTWVLRSITSYVNLTSHFLFSIDEYYKPTLLSLQLLKFLNISTYV